MTSFKFWKLNTSRVLNIGTAGGWTKASTGYTFRNASKKTIELVTHLNLTAKPFLPKLFPEIDAFIVFLSDKFSHSLTVVPHCFLSNFTISGEIEQRKLYCLSILSNQTNSHLIDN